ncbi:MAG: molybdopterin cofactor-binding domain-containing protein [Tepidisphaeraceae bacterium]|jgi:isoquinoline 1-oxidoreductase
MEDNNTTTQAAYDEPVDRVIFDFALSRRGFVQVLGAGLLIAVSEAPVLGQAAGGRGGGRRGGGFGGGGAKGITARLHIGKDGVITVLTGKVEGGQGARAELTQAAAEELHVPATSILLIMGDTDLTPDDGVTAGSRSTPSSVPAVRQGAAAARDVLVELAAKKWSVPAGEVQLRDGKATHTANKREATYAELVADVEGEKSLDRPIAPNVTLTAVEQFKVLGTSVPRPNARDLVTGTHKFPSDIVRPGMLYGRILRAPSYGAKMTGIDLAPAKAMKGVVVVQDGSFVGVAAPTASAADDALAAIEATAKWEPSPHPASTELFDLLRKRARGLPANPFADELANAAKKLKQAYNIAYIQHAPMEPRTAVAEWVDGKVTVWLGTQNPFGCRGEIAGALRIPPERVRVIVPDFGGGFGGKHSGEHGVEAARLAQAADKPVRIRWTREEEFTWAYFRPAGAIDAEASLDAQGKLTSWHFININSGGSAVESPYRIGKSRSQTVGSEAPLRQGSYRGLASAANNFARECFMDELAALAGQDPLAFRLAHLDNPRLRAVLEAATKQFDWVNRVKQKDSNVGVGLACGTEKGSFVAACVEVAIDRDKGEIAVRHLCAAFECGKILNPANLLSQVQGGMIMGLGPALREEMKFKDGKIQNAMFSKYLVPRFSDVPRIDVQLLDRPDLPSAGAGETPLIAVAPAIGNAVFHATGKRVREMPMRLG